MRTWLVVIGVVVAGLGAGLILTLFALSPGPATVTQFAVIAPDIPAHENQSWFVPGPASGGGSITVVWNSSADTNVSLFLATTCVSPIGFCATGHPALTWLMSTTGKGTTSSSTAPAYILVASNPAADPIRFSGSVSVTYGRAPVLPTWSWGVIALGALVLMVIGGIALFLGLFLAGDVYKDPDAEMEAVRHPSLPPEEFDSEPEDEPR